MKKYVFIIKQLFPLSASTEPKILGKFEFFASSDEDAENFKEKLGKLFAESAPIKTSPRKEYLVSFEEDIKL